MALRLPSPEKTPQGRNVVCSYTSFLHNSREKCTCTYMYIYNYTYTCTYIYNYTCTYIYNYTYTCTCMYVYYVVNISFIAEYKAISSFSSEREGDLSFDEGDILLVYWANKNGWWYGAVGSKQGWFPGSYVEVSV